MPGTPLTRAIARGGDMVEEAWEDISAVAGRDVARLSDRQIETVLAAVAVGLIGAAVLVGWWSLRRRA